ncbi:diphosphomevalonate decarboxylase [Bifidobacterium mongoliense]|uniref:diphosphomevalonate decarboxylase n=1 Tax=Bifidobacterium mongoliense TaxID=518643 RepID=UPI0030EBCEB1
MTEPVDDRATRHARRATATAHANIALIKYWGKADERLIIPRSSSLSLTLDGLSTTTTVTFGNDACDGADNGVADGARDEAGDGVADGADAAAADTDTAAPTSGDTLIIDGRRHEGTALQRVAKFMDLVRRMAGIDTPVRIVSRNTVPYGAGLASSASAFAALAAAGSRAAGLDLSPRGLSRLARRGSGSACRSVFGGLVQWHAGHDDESSYAEPVPCAMDLAIIVIAVSTGQKKLSSRSGMRRTVDTSPLYPAWIDAGERDMREALDAVARQDLEKLGEVSEANALGMHAAMIAARPAVLYWMPQTVAALHAVEAVRTSGLPAWSTMDAGPNVKVLTDAGHAQRVAQALRDRLPGCAVQVHRRGPGVVMENGYE